VSLCVLDTSFTFQWLLEDEATPEGDAALAAIGLGGAAVPALWSVEITNVLGVAERRGRLTREGVADALTFLRSIPLEVAEPSTLAEAGTVLDLMRRHRLTAYDAIYLELAIRLRLQLATKDRELLVAAPASGVALFAALP
jgi:predicted nucleic acid-binding protein